MKKSIISISLLVLGLATQAFAQNLESELNSLDLDKNEKIPASSSSEKLYSVQDRVMDLKNRFEVKVGGGQNLSGNSFLTSRQVSAELQYHINSNWSVALATSQVENTWTSTAQGFIDQHDYVPDVDYLKSRNEARIQYNLLYGKMRWLRNSVSYYDLYAALGYASNQLASGSSSGPVADMGVSHWIGKWGSFSWGLKDYYYEERGRTNSGSHHNVFGYLAMGYVFR